MNKPRICGTGQPSPYWKAWPEEFSIEDKDILVMYSDGVSDNLFKEDIIQCVSEEVDGMEMKDPQAAA